jgi:hypothetical protein
MPDPMMQPGMWATGVPAPNYAAPLLNFGQAGGQPRPPQPGQPQAQPQPQPQPPGANGAGSMPWAAALMRLLGMGQQQRPSPPLSLAAPNQGSPGGVNPMGGSPIY